MNEFTVGQTVYLSINNHRKVGLIDAKVKKIGKKWAALDFSGHRFDINTLKLDGGNYSSPGTVYRSPDEYEAQLELDRVWRIVSNNIRHTYKLKDGVTINDIRRAAQLLQVDDEEI